MGRFFLWDSSFSSPHTRRYFRPGRAPLRLLPLFSAHAEVFPTHHAQHHEHHPLLRTRGGISCKRRLLRDGLRSSPHKRRHFPRITREKLTLRLFSAHAEVFPRWGFVLGVRFALLRTRGGISPSKAQTEAERASSPHTRRYFQPAPLQHDGRGLFSAHAEVLF